MMGSGLLILLSALIAIAVVIYWITDRVADLREAAAEAHFPPLGELIDVEGTEVHVYVEGNGPDLVLIHGASGNLRDFTFSMVDLLKDRYRCIVVDRPGLGWTQTLGPTQPTWGNTGDSPQAQAALIRATCKQLGVQSPIVLGHSYGGAVALAWAVDAPEEISGLLALSAASNPWPGRLSEIYRINASWLGAMFFIPLVTAFLPEKGLRDRMALVFEPDTPPLGYPRHIGAELVLRRASLHCNAKHIWNLRPHIVDMSAHYKDRLTMPVTVVHGTADTIVPWDVHGAVLAETLPHAKVDLIEGAGHMPHHSHEFRVVEAIDALAKRAQLGEGP